MTRSAPVSPECMDSAELFTGLSPEQRRRVSVSAMTRAVSEGERLFEIGEEAREIYVVCRGQVELTFPLLVLGKRKEVRFQVLDAGSTLGWSALVPPHRLTMSARAVTATEICAFARTSMLELFDTDAAIAHAVCVNLAKVVAARLIEFQTLWVKEMQRNVALTYR